MLSVDNATHFTQAITDESTVTLTFKTLHDRTRGDPPLPYSHDDLLQKFTKARMIRLQLQEYYTDNTARDSFTGIPHYNHPFYRVSEVKVQSRCSCNGHAATCDDGCDCEHDTQGDQCGECKPLYNAVEWARGKDASTPNKCQACHSKSSRGPCNAFADACKFDLVNDVAVCLNCQNNTGGNGCETCLPVHTFGTDYSYHAGEGCVACSCDPAGVVADTTCNIDTGRCACKDAVTGIHCDTCQEGMYGLRADNLNGCAPCDCNSKGTAGSICDKTSGACDCADGYAGDRCDRCDEGYFTNQQGGCSPCHTECAECSAFGKSVGSVGAACSVCKHFQSTGSCVRECATSSFADEDKICVACHDKCVGGCSGATDSDCNTCRDVKLAGRCVEQCPSRMFSNASHVCEECDVECHPNYGCTGLGPGRCGKCRRYSMGGACVKQCPAGTFADGSNECQKCNGLCLQSRSCRGNGAKDCEMCDRFTMLLDSGERECLQSCPSYPDPHYAMDQLVSGEMTTVCGACNPECVGSCSGPKDSDCEACRTKSYNGACVKECPTQSFVDGNVCVPCDSACDPQHGCDSAGPQNCNKCIYNVSFSYDGVCLTECPAGYYAFNAGQTCRKCSDDCEECSGGSAMDCTSCPKHRIRYGSACLQGCPWTESFPKWMDDGERVCVPCHESCDTTAGCRGGADTECGACRYAYDTAGEKCLLECPSNQYRSHNITSPPGSTDQQPARCLPCDEQCGSGGCSGPEALDCAMCATVKYGDTCVAGCTTNQVAVGAECIDCSQQCAPGVGCTGPSASECEASQCRHAFDSSANSCVQTCPVGTFADDSGNGGNGAAFCNACSAQCKDGCNGPSVSDCKLCANAQVGDECVDSCPSRMFVGNGGLSNNLCTQCDPLCALDCAGAGPSLCIAEGSSTGCAPGAFSDGSRCYSECYEGSYPISNSTGQYCAACHDECRNGCTGPSAGNCVACRAFEVVTPGTTATAVSTTCVSECPNEFVVDESSTTCIECHPQCAGKGNTSASASAVPLVTKDPQCYGPGNDNCVACRNAATADGRCIEQCEVDEFKLGGKVCTKCHEQCVEGCNNAGPSSCLGSCKDWKIVDEGKCGEECPADSHFKFSVAGNSSQMCLPCHDECSVMTGDGGCPGGTSAADCKRCANVLDVNGRDCVATCEIKDFADTSDTMVAVGGVCMPCHSSCKRDEGCFGPNPDQCNSCTEGSYRYLDTCLSACPPLTVVEGALCKACDSNCLDGCSKQGPGACIVGNGIGMGDRTEFPKASASYWGCRAVAHCVKSCKQKNIKTMEAKCMPECPVGWHRDENNFCVACSTSCNAELGCSGPDSGVSENGCNPCPDGQFINVARECRACDLQCVSGCDGPLSENCDACVGVRGPDGFCYNTCLGKFAKTHYKHVAAGDGGGGADGVQGIRGGGNEKASCVACHEECAGGCSGPGADECIACKHFLDDTGFCIPLCEAGYEFFDKMIGEKLCRDCNVECRKGSACKGPTAAHCTECEGAQQADGVCVSSCDQETSFRSASASGNGWQCECKSNTVLIDKQCIKCHDECDEATSCFGPLPTQCIQCKNVALNDGRTCAATCPLNETPDSNGACYCQSGVRKDGVCTACSNQCGAEQGCFGATASDCVGGMKGCKNVFSDGKCAERCPRNEVADANGECKCSGYKGIDGNCSPCHEQCATCFGSSAQQCLQCKSFRRGSTCISSCSNRETPSLGNICSACHPECNVGCVAPGDPLACVGRTRCANVMDNGRCQATCPQDRPYVVDCTANPGISICAGVFDTICMSGCPSQLPFFNDTSRGPGQAPISPQLCVVSCASISDESVGIISDDGKQRCTTNADSFRSFEDKNQVASAMNLKMVAVVVGVVVLLVFIFVVSSTCCLDHTGTNINGMSSPQGFPTEGWAQPGDSIRPTYVNPEYAGSPASLTEGGSAYTDGYAQSPIAATPNYARALNTPGTSLGNPYSMSNDALFLSNDALFLDGTTSSHL